jgi:transposase
MKASQLCEIVTLQTEQIQDLLGRLQSQLQAKDYELVRSMAQTIEVLCGLIQQARMSIGRLRRLLFGSKTEKTGSLQGQTLPASPETKKKPKGHGRNGANRFPGAQKINVPHPTLRGGDPCPQCDKGKLSLKQPVRILRFIGQPLFAATLYLLERLRCNLCGAVFTAPAPPEAGLQKYDPTVGAMIGMARYGTGLPFHRIAKVQKSFGVPLAPSTQWQIAHQSAREVTPVYDQLVQQAAQGHLLHNDDTHMKVLSLAKTIAQEQSQPDSSEKPQRTGVFTSGIIAVAEGHQIALFMTGRQHAGENLADVLAHREPQRPHPIQMCDGLSRNYPKAFATIVANCIPHSRRAFVDVYASFPQECGRVLEDLAQVYKHEAFTKASALSAEQRLAYHQANSQPLMDKRVLAVSVHDAPGAPRVGSAANIRNQVYENKIYLPRRGRRTSATSGQLAPESSQDTPSS